ncbi:MAG: hypothetical protein K6347_04050 [Campylobacterales bacterium]
MTFTTTQNSGSVIIRVGGLTPEFLSQKVAECQAGACHCNCDPAMMEKIEAIDIQGSDDGSVMTIKGALSAEEVEKNFAACTQGW